MTVILEDVHRQLRDTHAIHIPASRLSELLYADDTLLLGMHNQEVEKQLQCIIDVGKEYGLEMNWQKVEMMTARCTATISRPDGQPLVKKPAITYLGASVAAGGDTASEVARRIGLAQSDFTKLDDVWRPARVTQQDKYRIYLVCVVSRLLYGLQTIAMTKSTLQRLDGFHARCVRKIVGIQPSYWSRVTNENVLAKVGARKFSILFLEQQLKYFGVLVRRPESCPVRQFIFDGDLLVKPAVESRRRGRPKLEWGTEMNKHVAQMFDSTAASHAAISNEKVWRESVRSYCSSRAF